MTLIVLGAIIFACSVYCAVDTWDRLAHPIENRLGDAEQDVWGFVLVFAFSTAVIGFWMVCMGLGER